MNDQQIRRLLEILENAVHEAQDVFTPDPAATDPAGEKLTDPQQWARLLARFVAAPDYSLTPEQVSHADIASGYAPPRCWGALQHAHQLAQERRRQAHHDHGCTRLVQH